ncbi:MAG: hypothetical protein GF344_02015 [Chitinivibrionales bacterium]|nr:hypothetical protein [Chitinivibrionales bacterium]MBD3355872.1 hypothetical protein [Chitinivibrionales bacterium]
MATLRNTRAALGDGRSEERIIHPQRVSMTQCGLLMKALRSSFPGTVRWSGLVFFLAVLAVQADPVAVILRTRGFVLARHENAERAIHVDKGYLCNGGTIITTGRTGLVELRYTNSMSTVVLAPQTEISVHRFKDQGYTTESCRLASGWCGFNVRERDSSSLDIFSGGTLLSVDASQLMVIHDKNRAVTTIFNFDGFGRVADRMYEDWIYVAPYSVAFVSADDVPQVGIIHPEELPQLMETAALLKDLKKPSTLIHRLTMRAADGGMVSPQGKLPVVGGVGTDVYATPSSGRRFVGWRVAKGIADVLEVAQETTLVRAAGSAVVEARFAKNPSLLKLDSENDDGRISPRGSVPMERGEPLTVRVRPRRGFRLERWKTSSGVEVTSEGEKALVRITGAKGNATAVFGPRRYRLTIEADSGGTVSPAGTVEVGYGDTMVVQATPQEGHYFLQWRVAEGDANIARVRTQRTKVVCDGADARIVAEFSDNSVEVEVYGSDNATVEPTGSFFVKRNENVRLRVVAEEGYEVTGWQSLYGRPRVEGLEDAVITTRRPARLRPVVEKKRYRLELESTRHGRVSPSGWVEVTHGDSVLLRAKPRRNKHFLGWHLRGGWAEIDHPHAESTTVRLTSGDAVVEARFASTVCTLQVEATEGGYVEPSGFIRNCEGCPRELIAIPNHKAAFVEWRVAEEDSAKVVLNDTLTNPEQTVVVRKGAAKLNAVFTTETAKLTLRGNGLGRVSPDRETYIVKNRWSSITATPNRGQRFLQWTPLTGTGVRIEDVWSAETDILVEGDEALVKAVFVPDTAGSDRYTDSMAVGDTSTISFIYHEQMGRVDKGPLLKAAAGKPVNVTARGLDVFTFSEWKVLDGAATVKNTSTASTSITPLSKEVRIMPIFSPRPVKRIEVRFMNTKGESKTITVRYQ